MRPGPIQGGMVHPYLRRRQGLEPVTYPSEQVKGVLERTLGVPIFQEQVMQLAVVAAGFTPGEADGLRRAMAAWRRKGGLEKFEHKLTEGMRVRGYSDAFAQAICRQIQGFGEYGFPESHAASFALLVYVSAWLKCHEPAAFAAALLNSQPMGFYAPAQLVQDARRHGVEVRAGRRHRERLGLHAGRWRGGTRVAARHAHGQGIVAGGRGTPGRGARERAVRIDRGHGAARATRPARPRAPRALGRARAARRPPAAGRLARRGRRAPARAARRRALR